MRNPLLGALIACGITAASCSGGASPTQPSVTSSPPVTGTPQSSPTIADTVIRVVSQRSGLAITNAEVTVSGATVKALGDGSFSVSSPQSDTPIDIAAPNYITRKTRIKGGRLAQSVTVDLIDQTPPFDMGFYQELVRGAKENPASVSRQPLWRWGRDPAFYVKTTLPDGRPVPQSSIENVLQGIRKFVPQWTGGRFKVATIEGGTEARSQSVGWINILFTAEAFNATTNVTAPCGLAFYPSGGIDNIAGSITFDLPELKDSKLAYCKCEASGTSPGSGLVAHELGHSLGFFHTSNRASVMFSSGCANDLPAIDQFHGSIAYSRQYGSLDPDTDPTTFTLSASFTPVTLQLINRPAIK